MNDEPGLIRHSTVLELVAVYEQSVRDISAGFALVLGAEKRLAVAFSDEYATSVGRSNHMRFDSVDDVLDELRRSIWGLLVERLGIRQMASVQRWNLLQEQIKNDKLPEITADSVEQMARGFYTALPEMLTEAVREVFGFLRPRHSEYKTNSEYEVGSRVILPYAVELGWCGIGNWHPRYRREEEFTALENVFSALDGKGQITKQHYSQLSNAIKQSNDGTGETEYFRFRCCKNNNLHLEFKRADLVRRLNEIAGGMNLTRGSAAQESALAVL